MAVVSAAEVYENVIAKKKKIRQSKNKKKSWRKNIDLTDIETALEVQEEDERLDVLGEESSKLFDLDIVDTSNKDEEDDSEGKKLPAFELEYTIDTNTGLKSTGKVKENKLIYAHRFLEGLPGSKAIKLRSRYSMKHTEAHKFDAKIKAPISSRALIKREKREEMNRVSYVLDKRQKKATRMMSFKNDIWYKPELTAGDTFAAEGIDHAQRLMHKKTFGHRVSKTRVNKVPDVIVPHPGLSYNPSLQDHQDLLHIAVDQEVLRQNRAAACRTARTKDFPLGAEKVSDDWLVVGDMENDSHTMMDVKQEGDEEESSLRKGPKDRTTHKQKLKQLRHKTKLLELRDAKLRLKRENEVHKIREFKTSIAETEEQIKRQQEQVKRTREGTEAAPPRFFKETAVDVALGDELSGTVRNVVTTSNPMSQVISHCYRRGMIAIKPRNRGRIELLRQRHVIRKKSKAVDALTEKELLGDRASGLMDTA